ncbi:hypothetical protein M2459_001963 [Parabacteroides sp. PF5-5]|uniref:hypothetical protein n=1 Tax=Bacteroidales TaxID=171549 RepID=UPI0013D618CF|nr:MULTISPECIES: hypothetical protein [Bacteroidales]MDH6306729.1 hypothetical protein [Parabacteroides sp. PH5-39]MDH6316220.1 hypothetical protein [Parabacteroides sp. PF5-13]MDH6321419.1 hypothetical protein [Parabacteroides sp. PH5-13]MDH6325150.1 hypothetical protein [Parabacteroides sp. PH5-8]MDH6327411.1 hypothetical protein [Parabacteroides sp. PH5-41]
MNTFYSIKELINALSRHKDLFAEMFAKRTMAYKYDFALEFTDEDHIQFLIDHAVIRQNEGFLELDDLYLQFFEQVLAINEEINISYINESIQNVKQHILYYLQENNETRKYTYLKTIKNSIRKIGNITVRNVIDLKRNTDNTFKNEPNYKNKKSKLEFLDKKREDISTLIHATERLLSEEELTFFKIAYDEELNRIETLLKRQLNECRHNLIEIQKQIIEYLNQIKYQSRFLEKLRQIKYLKDQFELESKTDIRKILSENNAVVFESNPAYPLKLSIDRLQTDDELLALIQKVFESIKIQANIRQKMAEIISDEYLDVEAEEMMFINLEEVKNRFTASGNHLFDFILNYNFQHEVDFNERVTLYCQLISQYENELIVSETFNVHENIEYAMVYPK